MARFGMKVKDVDTTQKAGGYGRLPDGNYGFEVDEISIKDHYDGREGMVFAVVLLVTEPEEFNKRKHFMDFGVIDPEHEDWEGRARDDLGKLLKGCGWDEELEFDDENYQDLIGMSGFMRMGLDKYRSDKSNKDTAKIWEYYYPDSEKEYVLGPFENQEKWTPAKQTQVEGRGSRDRGGREERGSRDRDRGGRSDRSERGGREDRGSREERGGRDEKEDRGGRDSDRSRGRDREESRGRDSGRDREERGDADDDIPFNGDREGGNNDREDRPRRGGGDNPWNKGNGGGRR